MIINFENFTQPLSTKEQSILTQIASILPAFVGKENAITNKTLRETVSEPITDTVLRKIINQIRINNILVGVCASQKGYYIAATKKEHQDYIQSLKERVSAIQEVLVHAQKDLESLWIHPTKAQVQVVIDTLQKAKDMVTNAGFAKAPVSMMTGVLHPCGTPMCHGGYYAIVKGMSSENQQDFTDGANAMATDLGFNHNTDLEDWASQNPQLWGNDSGGDMFCGSHAFHDKGEIKDLKIIIDHWKGVQKRLPR